MANLTTIEVLRIPGTLFPRGPYDEAADYKFLNFVESGGNGYVCLQPCTGIPVTNTAYWFKFVFKGDKGDAFTYADLTAEQKAELVRDATAAAQAAASSAQSAADDAAAALQKFNTIKAAIDALDPTSTEGSIQTIAAKQGLLESELDALGTEMIFGEDEVIDLTQYTAVRAYPNPTKWLTSNDSYPYYGIFIRLIGRKYAGGTFRFTGNGSKTGYFGFLKYRVLTNNSTVDYATGCERVSIHIGETVEATAPDDANYLYICTLTTEDVTPSKVEYVCSVKISDIDTAPKAGSNALVSSNGIHDVLYPLMDGEDLTHTFDNVVTSLNLVGSETNFTAAENYETHWFLAEKGRTYHFRFFNFASSSKLSWRVSASKKEPADGVVCKNLLNLVNLNSKAESSFEYTATDDCYLNVSNYVGIVPPTVTSHVAAAFDGVTKIDERPIEGSDNLVSSGGVYSQLYGGGKSAPVATKRVAHLNLSSAATSYALGDNYSTRYFLARKGVTYTITVDSTYDSSLREVRIAYCENIPAHSVPVVQNFGAIKPTSSNKRVSQSFTPTRDIYLTISYYTIVFNHEDGGTIDSTFEITAQPIGVACSIDGLDYKLSGFHTGFAGKERWMIANAREHNGEMSGTVGLLHFSDLHGDYGAALAIKDFYDRYSDLISDVLNTGDSVYQKFSNGIAPITEAGLEIALTAVGNHDSSNSTSGVGSWITDAEAYATYLAPYVSGWNVTQPEGAATDSLLYYYKDYTSANVRLIVLASITPPSSQLQWLTDTLADANTKGYTVVIAAHYLPVNWTSEEAVKRADGARVTFHSYGRTEFTETYSVFPSAYINAVQSFIDGGGKFAVWLHGHMHSDALYVPTDYPDILVCGISQAGFRPGWYIGKRMIGDHLANYVVIDPLSNLLKIVRIGLRSDNRMRGINVLCMNYKTHTVYENY